eukprot:GHVU01034749.1.p1 GENE.GHVU01034749.1~~GHVU01034749.1.p1  ORF type:complete len:162 (-),score=4.39 GHVU01034749.1:259-744(-)
MRPSSVITPMPHRPTDRPTHLTMCGTTVLCESALQVRVDAEVIQRALQAGAWAAVSGEPSLADDRGPLPHTRAASFPPRRFEDSREALADSMARRPLPKPCPPTGAGFAFFFIRVGRGLGGGFGAASWKSECTRWPSGGGLSYCDCGRPPQRIQSHWAVSE